MKSPDLAASLASLKAAQIPVPLYVFITIYNKATRDCYINYMEGAKILHDWLTDKGKIPLELPADTPETRVPRLLKGYEMQQVINIINPDKYHRIERAIYNIAKEI
jgi:hypothetical protein